MTAQAVAVNVTGSGAVCTTVCTYRGLSIRDTSGAANTVTLYDSASAASGTVLATFTLTANGSAGENVPDGVRAANGIFLQSTGSVAGSVRVG